MFVLRVQPHSTCSLQTIDMLRDALLAFACLFNKLCAQVSLTLTVLVTTIDALQHFETG